MCSQIYDNLSQNDSHLKHHADESFVLIPVIVEKCIKVNVMSMGEERNENQQQKMEIDWRIPQRCDAFTSEIK